MITFLSLLIMLAAVVVVGVVAVYSVRSVRGAGVDQGAVFVKTAELLKAQSEMEFKQGEALMEQVRAEVARATRQRETAPRGADEGKLPQEMLDGFAAMRAKGMDPYKPEDVAKWEDGLGPENG